MSELNLEKQIENMLKELKEIKENQQNINEKMEQMQQTINNIQEDIYVGEDFDFEIVCPYCEHEFVIDIDECNENVKCPECNNVIELNWSGDLHEGGCSGHCHGCASCDEDEDM